jgi:UDP-N-acetylglucosamine--N-acetylmuramyl-(pentapeptide) pyrophosphoryl-undecaprenol N-acetylglucosamine transferase
MEQNTSIPVEVHTIMAGKFRRYRHLTMLRQLFMPRIVLANFGDVFKVLGGFIQSLILIRRFRPDAVFAKGGYVCLPVGMAAHLLRVPLVIHDSDARPGLTNTILSRWASAIGTGSPLENYPYPAAITRYVGVPIGAEFTPFSEVEQRAAKRGLGFDEQLPLVVVTGGGLGAVSINIAMLQAAPRLLAENVNIYHVTGRKNFEEVNMLAIKDTRYQIVPFVYEGMAQTLGAADIVISRASATFTQELAGLAKPSILVPASTLHDQHKNAEVYRAADAAVVLTDEDLKEPNVLYEAIVGLLHDVERQKGLAANLHQFARPHAARDVAAMIIETIYK